MKRHQNGSERSEFIKGEIRWLPLQIRIIQYSTLKM